LEEIFDDVVKVNVKAESVFEPVVQENRKHQVAA
jgi:hypothetical protein